MHFVQPSFHLFRHTIKSGVELKVKGIKFLVCDAAFRMESVHKVRVWLEGLHHGRTQDTERFPSSWAKVDLNVFSRHGYLSHLIDEWWETAESPPD
ncbi:protein of unknown function [Nitrospira japonica]|uniref:Uncharacterized protein n=1 Tax=Nitrospira japonica TaxID=1325564 RepID=A0A1W1I1A9_9BACT|nr:protein of unknown function [Nitrospira japonica]